MHDAPAERRADRPRVGAVPVRGDLIRRAAVRPRVRRPTRPTLASKERRLVGKTVLKWGTDEQRARLLPGVCSGEGLGCSVAGAELLATMRAGVGVIIVVTAGVRVADAPSDAALAHPVVTKAASVSPTSPPATATPAS